MVNLMNSIMNAVGTATAPQVGGDPIFECNYEENCTPLYEAIEAATTDASYAKILNYLENGIWIGFQVPNNESPEDQARTWVTRFDNENDKKVKWSQLPLHLAIVCGSPFSIVKALVKLYPKALRCTDDQHMLPLHLSLRQGSSDEIVAFLLKEFPEAVYAKGKNGRTPVDCALRAKDKNRGKILEIFLDKTKKRLSKKVIDERATLQEMVETKNKSLEALKSELSVKDALVGNLRQELAKARQESQAIREKVAVTESDYISKINDLETCQTELEGEVKEVTDKLRDEKLIEALEMQLKIERLESEKQQLELTERKARKAEAMSRRELDKIIDMVSKTSTNGNWTKIKREFEDLQAKRLQMGVIQAKDDISSLKRELDRTLDDDKSVGNKSLHSIKKSVAKLQDAEKSIKSSGDLHALQTEVESLKEQLKNLSNASQMKEEVAALKAVMEDELRFSKGKTYEELDSLKKAVKVINESDLQTKTAEELASLKHDLQALKTTITERQLENTTKKDLESLSEAIQAAMTTPDSKILGQLQALNEKVQAINSKYSSSTTKDETIAFKKEVEALKDEYKAIEITSKIQEEAAGLKRSVEEEIQKSQGKTQQELVLIKQAIKMLVDKGLENKDTDELSRVKSELGAVKQNLKSIEEASKTQVELAVMKKSLEYQIQSSVGKTAKELHDMKMAVDAINMESQESKKLKALLTEEIKEANNKTEKELLEMKKALDKINLSRLESKNVEDWDAVRKEMDAMKMELQEKNVADLTSAEQELMAMKKVVETIKAQEMKSSTDLAALRQEMSRMRDELVVGTTSEWKMRQAIEALKNEARAEKGLPPKKDKDKPGLKKFLARRFNRKIGGGDSTTGSTKRRTSMSFGSSFDDSIYGGADDKSLVENNTALDSTPILPPSLSNVDIQDDTVESDDSNDDEQIENKQEVEIRDTTNTILEQVVAA